MKHMLIISSSLSILLHRIELGFLYGRHFRLELRINSRSNPSIRFRARRMGLTGWTGIESLISSFKSWGGGEPEGSSAPTLDGSAKAE